MRPVTISGWALQIRVDREDEPFISLHRGADSIYKTRDDARMGRVMLLFEFELYSITPVRVEITVAPQAAMGGV